MCAFKTLPAPRIPETIKRKNATVGIEADLFILLISLKQKKILGKVTLKSGVSKRILIQCMNSLFELLQHHSVFGRYAVDQFNENLLHWQEDFQKQPPVGRCSCILKKNQINLKCIGTQKNIAGVDVGH